MKPQIDIDRIGIDYPKLEIEESADIIFLIDYQLNQKGLEFFLSNYFNTFKESDDVLSIIHSHSINQDQFVELLSSLTDDLEKIPNLTFYHQLNSNHFLELISASDIIVDLENDTNFVVTAMAMNKQIIRLSDKKYDLALPPTTIHYIQSSNIQECLTSFQNPLKQFNTRRFIIQTNLISTSEIVSKNTAFIGLGLSEVHQGVDSQDFYESIISVLSTNIKHSESYIVLGKNNHGQQFVEKLNTSDIHDYCSGYHLDYKEFNEDFGHLNRDLVAQSSFKESRLKYLILTTARQDYQQLIRFLKFRFQNTVIILPFLEKQSWQWHELEPHQPILVLTLVRSGTVRLNPVFYHLMTIFKRDKVSFLEPYFNKTFMSKLKGPSSSIKEKTLIESIKATQIDNNIRIPLQNELDDYHMNALSQLDWYQVMYMGMHAFSPINIFKNKKDLKIVLLMRDPRDIIISFYFAVIHTSYYYYSKNMSIGKEYQFPDGLKEKLILDLIKNGSNYVSPSKLISFPPLKTLVNHFIEAMSYSNVFIVKFEDIHERPFHIYKQLLDWLNLLTQPLTTLTEENLKQSIDMGSFEYQTQGKRKRGEKLDYHSPSFGVYRKGITGDWKNHFTPKIIKTVKEICGSELIQLKYENSFDW